MSTTSRLFPLDLAQLPGTLFGPPPVRIEEYTDADTYVVRAEVSGVDPDKDIAVSVYGDRLRIRVERAEEHLDKTHSEFQYGTFTRSITLPRTAVEDGITATCVAGVLEVRVPLAGTVLPGRDIPVTRQAPARKPEHKRS